jgi:hypothetical protein
MLLESLVAQSEHREWVRRFNKRAARGEFVKHERPASDRRIRRADWFSDLALTVRNQLSRNWAQGLLTRLRLSE